MSRSIKNHLRNSVAAIALAGWSVLAGGCLGGTSPMREPIVTSMDQVPQPSSDLNRGLVHLVAGRNGLAIADFEKALAAEPRSERILNLLGVTYDRIGRHDVARTYFTQALAVDPNSGETLNNIGTSYYLESDYPTAQRYFQQALDLSDGALQNAIRGRLLVLQDRLPQAAPEKAALAVSSQDSSRLQQLVRTSEHTYELSTTEAPSKHTLETCGTACATSGQTALAEPSVEPPPLPPAVIPHPVQVSQIAASTPNFASLHLEVSNGAGRRKLAARMSHFLTSAGLTPRYITNADRFNYARTTIVYRKGLETAARQLAQQLPVNAELVLSEGTWPNLRIILGRDILPFDLTLSASLREAGHAELLG